MKAWGGKEMGIGFWGLRQETFISYWGMAYVPGPHAGREGRAIGYLAVLSGVCVCFVSMIAYM